MGVNHRWTDGEESLAGSLITTFAVGELKLLALSVPASSLSSGNFYDVIEMPGGTTLYVCISQDHIKELVSDVDDPYQVGFSFGVFIGNLLTSIYFELMSEAEDD